LDILILLLPISEVGNFQVALQIFLTLTSISIPFAIRNTKVVGILLLILPTISFGMSVNTNGIELNSEGISQIVGFILFLIAGIMALLHKDDDNKKKRKAFTIILGFLDKINSVQEWNERLHELHRKLRIYEDILPDDVRYTINTVATDTDLSHLRKQTSEQLSKLHREPIERDIKVAAVILTISFLSMVAGINALDLRDHVAQSLIDSNEFIKTNFVDKLLIPTNDTSDTTTESETDTETDNEFPTVEASAEPESVSYSHCAELQTVKLQAIGKDKEGPVSYKWKQTEGDKVTFLGSDDQPDLTFESPCKKQKLSFSVTVKDNNGASATDETSVDVSASSSPDSSNKQPTVSASSDPGSAYFDPHDTNCDDMSSITLHAEAQDTDGNIVSYKWEQTEGSQGQFITNDLSDVSFEPPCEKQKISFSVTVKDNNGASATDETSVDVSASSSPDSSPSSPPQDDPTPSPAPNDADDPTPSPAPNDADDPTPLP
jgi:hypothetical protein